MERYERLVGYKMKKYEFYTDLMGIECKEYYNGEYLPFEEAREFTKSLRLKSKEEWDKYCKSGNKPNNIPSCPHQVYKNKGWKGYGDFLGTGNIALHKMIFLSFEKAREVTRSLNLK